MLQIVIRLLLLLVSIPPGCLPRVSGHEQDAISTGNPGEDRQQAQITSDGHLLQPSQGNIDQTCQFGIGRS